MVLPDPFRGMGARRNAVETQQSGTQISATCPVISAHHSVEKWGLHHHDEVARSGDCTTTMSRRNGSALVERSTNSWMKLTNEMAE